METKKTLERRLSDIKCYLFTNHPFWGTVAANLKFVVSEDINTLAATDCHSTVYFHPECMSLSSEEFKFVVLHELLHAVLMHSQRRERRDPVLWNIATDFAVNSILIDEMGMKMPENYPGLYNSRFKNRSAEHIYRELKEMTRNQKIYIAFFPLPGGGSESGETTGGISSPGGVDEKSVRVFEVTVAGAKEITDEKEKREILKNKNTIIVKGIGPEDLKKSKNPSQEESRMKDVIAQAHLIQQKYGHKARGTLPASIAEFIKKIVEPKVPFEVLLSRYASEIIAGKSEYSYCPIHKRHYLEFEAILPTVSKEEVPKVVVAVDTSGSISRKELELFAGAVKKMSTITPELTVLTCDCAIHQVIRASEIENFLRNLRFEGRGGTSHIPVFEYIDRHIKNPDVVICLTDGHSEYPEKKPKYPVIWVLTPNHKEPPWGHKIVMEKAKEGESYD